MSVARKVVVTVAVLIVLVAMFRRGLVSRSDTPIGGKWFIRTESSNLPEAGGYHKYLRRRTLFGSELVGSADVRYLGDDCVLYIARDGMNARCGDHVPFHMDRSGSIRMVGSDSVYVLGRPVALADIRKQALVAKPRVDRPD